MLSNLFDMNLGTGSELFLTISNSSVIILSAWLLVYFGFSLYEAGLYRRQNNRWIKSRSGIMLLFMSVSGLLFLAALAYLTLLSRSSGYGGAAETDLFYELKLAFEYQDWNLHLENPYWLWQTINNILLFVPGGILVPWWCSRSQRKLTFWAAALIGFSLSFVIEFTQLVTDLGIFEVSDLLNNTLGFIMGFIIYRLVKFICLLRSRGVRQKLMALSPYA